MLVHAQLGRDDLAGNAIGAAQNDPASLGQGSPHTTPSNLPLQVITLLAAEYQRCSWPTCRVFHRCAPLETRAAYNEANFSSR
jgi:hypothetical protein